jgi:hypothetical protein
MTKTQILSSIFVIAILSTVVAIFCVCGKRPEQTHEVAARLQLNAPKFKTFVQNRVGRITHQEPDGTNKTYDIPLEGSSVKRLTLTSEKTLRLPDHHGFTDLALVSIANNKATIAYLSKINLTSFGENKTSVETGTVTIDVLKNDR